MTPEQATRLIEQIPAAVKQAIESELPIAMMDLEADLKESRFGRGETAAGGRIGSYSTKPMYVSVAGAQARYGSQIPTSKLRPRGKPAKGRKRGHTARTLFGQVVPLQSMYFPDGYKGFRDLMGRPTDTMDLKLTGNMMKSIQTGTEKNVSTIAFMDDTAAKIARGHEEKRGVEIFTANAEEVQRVVDQLSAAANEVMDNLLSNV